VNDLKAIAQICQQLSKTERNFTLKKGETTIHGKDMEMATAREKHFVEAIKDITNQLFQRRQNN
jgi:hypothetical protein